MYVEVLDHARHDGGGLGRAIGFSRQDSVSRSPHGTRVFGTFLRALPLKSALQLSAVLSCVSLATRSGPSFAQVSQV